MIQKLSQLAKIVMGQSLKSSAYNNKQFGLPFCKEDPLLEISFQHLTLGLQNGIKNLNKMIFYLSTSRSRASRSKEASNRENVCFIGYEA